MKFCAVIVAFIFLLSSCSDDQLPVYGNKVAVEKTIDGKTVVDSVDYTLPNFNFINQDSNTVNAATIEGKIYVADFFFTSCPSICPKMKKEMLRIYDKYKTDDRVLLLSYSIDPVRDSVPRLKNYCAKLGIDNSAKWHLLTGNKDSIYSLAESYLVSAAEDPDAPGGHVHSGNFILVDTHRRLRGYYDGTKEESVTELLADMDKLLKENE